MIKKLEKKLGIIALSIVMVLSMMGCSDSEDSSTVVGEYNGWEESDKDFSEYKTP